MSEKLCTLRTKGGGGGRYTETSLWTNQSPTSSFANQTVTLSDSVSNYKYIKFVYRFSTSSAKESSAIYSVDDVVGFVNVDGNFLGGGLAYPALNIARAVIYKSPTSFEFGTSYRSGASGTYNSNLIPLEILGLNELKPGTDVGLVTNGASFSAKTSVTINCKVGDYIALGYARSASGYNILWNGTILGQSSDFVTGHSLSTNNFMSIVKASQTSNTFSVASGATLTGTYQIFSLG